MFIKMFLHNHENVISALKTGLNSNLAAALMTIFFDVV